MKNTRSRNSQPNKPNKNNNEKIYYIIIGVLLVILLAIIIFIFSNRDSATDLEETDLEPETGEVIDVDETDETDDSESEEDVEVSEPEEDTETDSESEETDTEPESEEWEEDTDLEEDTEEDTSDTDYEVTEDAPLDESHTIDYANGSSDRVAIANAASSVTGLNSSDMITNWVGNDGPGRVFTIVSNVSQSEVYRLTLQYGEGQWHVTGVQELEGVPAEYN